jgi:hypothetical protein
MAIKVQRRVGAQPLPSVRAQQPVQAGGGLERSLSKLGANAAEIGQLAVKIKRSNDDAVVRGAINEAMETGDTLLNDPEHGLVTRVGEDGINDSKGFLENYDKVGADLRKKMNDDVQKADFDIRWANERRQFSHAVNSHVATQMDVVRKQNFAGALFRTREKALGAIRRGDFAGLEAAMAQQAAEIDREADLQGWVPEKTDEIKKRLASEIHLQAVDILLDGGLVSGQRDQYGAPTGAASYMSVYGDQIVEGEAKTKAIRAISAAAENDAVINFANKELAKTITDLRPRGDFSAVISKIRANPDFNEKQKLAGEQHIINGENRANIADDLSDGPLMDRFEFGMYENGAPDESLFERMTSRGKKRAAKSKDSWYRARVSTNAEARRIQADIDRIILYQFDALMADPQQQLGINVEEFAEGGTRRVKEALRAKVANVERAQAAGRGVPLAQFRSLVGNKMIEIGMTDKPQIAEFGRFMLDWYLEKLNQTPGFRPTKNDIDDALASFNEVMNKKEKEGFFGWFYDTERKWQWIKEGKAIPGLSGQEQTFTDDEGNQIRRPTTVRSPGPAVLTSNNPQPGFVGISMGPNGPTGVIRVSEVEKTLNDFPDAFIIKDTR